MLDRSREKFLDRNAVSAHKKLAPGFEHLGECLQTGLRVPSASAFHFDRRQRAARAHHEIHLPVALAPVEDLAAARGGGIREVRAHRRFGEPAPEIAVRARFLLKVLSIFTQDSE